MDISAFLFVPSRGKGGYFGGGIDLIDVSGHLRTVRRAIGFEDTERDVVVNCCGWQRFLNRDYSQQRTKGRLDYQIIYVFRGTGNYFIGDSWHKLSAGHILLFRPGDPQVYSYFAREQPEIYWIHFTGIRIPELLSRYQIENCYIGECLLIRQLFQEIILELQLKKALYEDIIICSFYKILALIRRTRLSLLSPLENNFSVERLIMQLNQRYMDSWSLPSMARYCSLSEDYFSHLFKKQMGCSPVKYLTDLRIEKAKELLMAGNISVSEVSSLVGFEDPLYFSRVFKKKTGVPPRRFQQDTFMAQNPF